jgi:hypothetical protein
VWVSFLTYGIFLVLLVFGAWLLAETRDEEEEALRRVTDERQKSTVDARSSFATTEVPTMTTVSVR